MKRVLIVAPHFPPVNAADMHRARVSLAALRVVRLAAVRADGRARLPGDAARAAPARDVAAGLPIIAYTGALPARWTRPLGVGSVGLRAFAHLYREGARIIARESIDLVFFSTTVFPAMALGRLWKRRFGVPYVLDIQDAWLSDYYDDKPDRGAAAEVRVGARAPRDARAVHDAQRSTGSSPSRAAYLDDAAAPLSVDHRGHVPHGAVWRERRRLRRRRRR